MITIKEIAVLGQVSTGTVDRVIHNRPGVSLKTSKRVKALLEKHNFKLNDVASKLANRKKYNLATLIPSFDRENSFWEEPYLGILKREEEVGFYGVSGTNFTFNQFDARSYLSEFYSLLKSKPDAVIIVPIFKEQTKEIVNKLDLEGIPYLFLNTDIEGYRNLSFVGQDSMKSGRLAAKLMHVSVGDNPEVLIVKLRKKLNSHHAIFNRVVGFNNYFSEKDNVLKINSLTFDSLKNLKIIGEQLNEYLTNKTKIKGLYIPSSQIAQIVKLLTEENLKKLTLIGHDTTKANLLALKDDKVSFLISQKSYDQGYDAISIMTDYLLEKKQPIKNSYSPLEIITKENM